MLRMNRVSLGGEGSLSIKPWYGAEGSVTSILRQYSVPIPHKAGCAGNPHEPRIVLLRSAPGREVSEDEPVES